MNDIQELHYEAMRLADQADQYSRKRKLSKAKEIRQRAFSLERQAAELCPADLEPTRSVLHRSAGELALECGALREAERVVAAALSGNPPDEIAEELRDLLERIYFDLPSRRPRRTLSGSK